VEIETQGRVGTPEVELREGARSNSEAREPAVSISNGILAGGGGGLMIEVNQAGGPAVVMLRHLLIGERALDDRCATVAAPVGPEHPEVSDQAWKSEFPGAGVCASGMQKHERLSVPVFFVVGVNLAELCVWRNLASLSRPNNLLITQSLRCIERGCQMID
jgi:hypothetical protein